MVSESLFVVQCDADSGASFSNDGKALILVVEKSENTADTIEDVRRTKNMFFMNKVITSDRQQLAPDRCGSEGQASRLDQVIPARDVHRLVGHTRRLHVP